MRTFAALLVLGWLLREPNGTGSTIAKLQKTMSR
jgi:hypothetical protein